MGKMILTENLSFVRSSLFLCLSLSVCLSVSLSLSLPPPPPPPTPSTIHLTRDLFGQDKKHVDGNNTKPTFESAPPPPPPPYFEFNLDLWDKHQLFLFCTKSRLVTRYPKTNDDREKKKKKKKEKKRRRKKWGGGGGGWNGERKEKNYKKIPLALRV